MGIENIKKLINNLLEKNDPFWKAHITAVVDNSIKLAENLGAEKEVCEISAWLHDISKLEGNSKDHHILGSIRAEEILIEEGYGKDFIEKVKGCILKHSSDKNYPPETLEEKVVACSDSTSHFNLFVEFVHKFLETTNYDYKATKLKLIRKYENAFDKILPEIKEEYQKKLDAIKLVLNY